eukprot:GHUV01021552.1.p1 GENE.GHUV01021552.1~~GHUV01021552.1.p1  ORF type:complete len:121 (+),score=30.81 GHUV01021552.1:186-548(+)
MAAPEDVSTAAAARYGLSGKACLVTGGTKGIGRAVVEEMCALGAKVFFCSRSQADVDEALTTLQQQGYQVWGMAVDVADRDQRQQLVQKVSETFHGKLHVLVNNVGTNIRKRSEDFTEQV